MKDVRRVNDGVAKSRKESGVKVAYKAQSGFQQPVVSDRSTQIVSITGIGSAENLWYSVDYHRSWITTDRC